MADPPPYTIRFASPRDARVLSAFGSLTFAESYASQNTPADIELYLAQAFSLEQIAAELNQARNRFLLADTGMSLIGYAKLAEGNPPPGVPGNFPLELARIYVDPVWIGHGVGSALMETAIKTTVDSGRDVLWLGVWQQNPRAIQFYKRWGFKIVGEKKFQLGKDLQDDFVLARRIT